MKTDLVEIFQTIRASLQPYAANGFTARTNSDTQYELWSEKNVDINGHTQTEIYFAGAVIEADHVDFNFTPLLKDDAIKALIHADLLALWNHDQTFKITELSDELMEQISDALVVGFTSYKQKGWV